VDPSDFEAAFRECLNSISAGARLRLSPTPSGYLHRGNVYNFLQTYQLWKRSEGATLLLRIDDLDAARFRPEYLSHIFSTLGQLNIHPNLGPANPREFHSRWSQQHRMHLYEAALETLREKSLLYACRRSRKDLAAPTDNVPSPPDIQNCQLDDSDVNWRLRTPEAFPIPNFIVRRRDGIPAYQLASVVDDSHFGITHVVRGADLVPSTLAQLYLAECLDLPAFREITFLHHPLLLDEYGHKLSKSTGALPYNGDLPLQPPI
jgi:glutamyl-tRNA synthetase